MTPSPMLKLAIIVGSTRPGRNCEAVAKWAYEIARKRVDADFALLDLANFQMPLLDEPMPSASIGTSARFRRLTSEVGV
jgi:NAD(P)H-dependent FMN reductase